MNRNPLIEKLLDKKEVLRIFICFIIAVLLYVFHQASLVEKKTFVLPLNVIENGIVTNIGQIPENISVVVRTDPDNMKSVSNSDFYASINLNGITQGGTYDLPVVVKLSEKLMAMDPFEIMLKDESVSVTVDKKSAKYVSVTPSVIGEVAHGYKISNITMSPPAVLITGPVSVLRAIDSVYTTKINVSNAENNFSTEAYYLKQTDMFKVEEKGPYKAEISLEALSTEREFTDISIEILGLDENLELQNSLPFTKVKLSGNMRQLESYTLPNHFAQIDLSEIKEEGTYEIQVKYNVPKNFELLESSYNSVTVFVGVKEKETDGENQAHHSEIEEPHVFDNVTLPEGQ